MLASDVIPSDTSSDTTPPSHAFIWAIRHHWATFEEQSNHDDDNDVDLYRVAHGTGLKTRDMYIPGATRWSTTATCSIIAATIIIPIIIIRDDSH